MYCDCITYWLAPLSSRHGGILVYSLKQISRSRCLSHGIGNQKLCGSSIHASARVIKFKMPVSIFLGRQAHTWRHVGQGKNWEWFFQLNSQFFNTEKEEGDNGHDWNESNMVPGLWHTGLQWRNTMSKEWKSELLVLTRITANQQLTLPKDDHKPNGSPVIHPPKNLAVCLVYTRGIGDVKIRSQAPMAFANSTQLLSSSMRRK